MPYAFGQRKQVFVDWELIEPGYGVGWAKQRPDPWEMPSGLRLVTPAPILDPQPLIQAERPWESRINVYCTWFEDEGRYRLYYECYYTPEGGEPSDFGAMLAYAESEDGLSWHKPEIGAVEFRGSRANNLVYALDVTRRRGAHGATVFKDPSAPADERYKLIHMGREGGRLCVFGAVSPDGLHWQALAEPLIADYMSDTQTVARFDPDKGRYVGYFRGWQGAVPGEWHGRRSIAYAETEDFRHWPKPELIVTPGVRDEPCTDFYTNSYTPWPGAERAHLLFPAFYRRALDITEVHLMTSRDGLHWERPAERAILPAGGPGSASEGGLYAGCGLIAAQPGTWALPVGPVWYTHNQGFYPGGEPRTPTQRGHLVRAVWREDGLMALEAATEGRCLTVPFTFTGRQLVVNAWTRFGGTLRCELTDAHGAALPGRSLAECDPITGDALQQVVRWGGNAELSPWTGQPVRLRLALCRARLYAFQFA